MKQLANIIAPQQQWLIPLLLTVGVHLMVLLPTILAPQLGFWQRQRPPVDIQTVSLFDIGDLAPTPAAAPPAPATPTIEPAAPTPAPPPEAIAIPPESTPEPAAAPRGEPRTIAPQTPTKVAVRSDPPPAPLSTRPIRTRADDDELRQLREYYQLEAQAREARRDAEIARQRAVDAVRENILAQATPAASPDQRETPTPPAAANTTEQAGQVTARRGAPTSLDAATREYLVRLQQHIQAYWTLPNLPSWDENTVATIVITIRRDGTLDNVAFEKQSENMYFNQLARKAIDDAAPMPAFPAALRDSELEIGFNFRPGAVSY
ncbi:energy transducer TonB [Desulfurivibrio alkaliphilus]|uniref:TonB family protein n=1 Tax=Desulfurivibrio alkaliphilus (strain DSM 19089 / UNIQEM U267 / AHT2) TaxID=589865 RepID=D6Z217_DESAT|nr:energy transducer TonB [Desulfurivibrio alkaliphilus]ADH85592.1 hypothetical protein DaAHT2_0888 [Desulfurivibrio alkaliphilus AHT 2]